MRKLKLQRYRKHKEEWLIWLLFQSFARRQSEDASSLLVSIWARPRTLYLWCKVAQRCGSGVNSNAYIAVGKQSCNGKYTNEYIFWCGVFIEEKLGLKVNITKSKVDKPQGLKYLGFGFYFDSRAHQFKAKPHAKSVAKFKKRMKELTCRSWGVGNSYKVKKLNQLIRGWINYFKIGNMKTLCREMDKHIRYRLRMCIWKQWKTPQNRIKNLMKLGVDKDTAWITAYTGSRIAYVCQRRVMNFAINKERLTRFGLVSMLDYYTERRVTC